MQIYLPFLMAFAKQYLLKFRTKALVWLTGTKVYNWALTNVIPHIRFSLYYTSMRGWKYHRGYKLLKKGHMILTTDKHKLSTVVIGGEFAHAGLCVSKDEDFECAEMTHKNFTRSCFSDMCYEADRIVILECVDWDEKYVDEVLIPTCLTFSNAKYDNQFKLDLGNEFLYCSEMIYSADKERRLQANTEDLVALGRPYISPTGLYKAKNVRVIWDSDKETK